MTSNTSGMMNDTAISSSIKKLLENYSQKVRGFHMHFNVKYDIELNGIYWALDVSAKPCD